jgi:hypothetical protein
VQVIGDSDAVPAGRPVHYQTLKMRLDQIAHVNTLHRHRAAVDSHVRDLPSWRKEVGIARCVPNDKLRHIGIDRRELLTLTDQRLPRMKHNRHTRLRRELPCRDMDHAGCAAS